MAKPFDIEQSRREMRALQQFKDYMWEHCRAGCTDDDGHSNPGLCPKCLGEYLAGIHKELLDLAERGKGHDC